MNIIAHLSSADDYSLRLKKIADELLSDQTNDDEIKAAALSLYELCSSIAGIDENSGCSIETEKTLLACGEAVSPEDAARCVLDYKRTSKFMKGLYAAILAAQKRFPDATIEILYAGCGPFAPLTLPLTSQFSAAEIKFTLLDVHQRSLDAARRIFQFLGKSDYVRDYIQCDAASYRHDARHVIHIAVAEALQRALEKEPQAAITMNLALQLCPRGIFIPERITVDCCLCDLTKEFQSLSAGADTGDSLSLDGRVRIHLGRVFELTADNCRNLLASGDSSEKRGDFLQPKLISVPKDLNGEFHLMLLTEISVFGNIALNEYESGLTCPKILYDAGKTQSGNVIEFEYQLGDKPGFKYRFL
jgi:hypothetical protein